MDYETAYEYITDDFTVKIEKPLRSEKEQQEAYEETIKRIAFYLEEVIQDVPCTLKASNLSEEDKPLSEG